MLGLFKRKKQEKKEDFLEPEVPEVEPIHVTDEDFEEVILKADKPAVVDFWSEYCSPCHVMAYVMDDLAEAFDGRAIVAKLQVDENPKTPEKYGIMGVPTMVFFKDGIEVDRLVGVHMFNTMEQHLEALLD